MLRIIRVTSLYWLIIPIYALLVRLFPLDDLAAHDVVGKSADVSRSLPFGLNSFFENQRSIASRSHACPSEAMTGSCMSSWVIGQRYSSGVPRCFCLAAYVMQRGVTDIRAARVHVATLMQ